MTERLYNEIGAARKNLLGFVIAGLLFQQAARGANPFNSVDVEDLFNAVRALASREHMDAAPFVAMWHPLVEQVERTGASRRGWNTPEAILGKQIDRGLAELGGSWSSTVGDQIARGIAEFVGQPSPGTKFEELASDMIGLLAGILESPEKDIRYLGALAQVFRDQGRLTVATLNYDTTVEDALRLEGLVCDTGIGSWALEGRLDLHSDQPHVLKLHGSIDWVETLEPSPSGTVLVPGSRVAPNIATPRWRTTPAVIFGGHNKLTAEGPFLDLLREFQVGLEDADALAVVGYSFRDEHVNAAIRTWLNGSENRRIAVLNGGTNPPVGKFGSDLFARQGDRVVFRSGGARAELGAVLQIAAGTAAA